MPVTLFGNEKTDSQGSRGHWLASGTPSPLRVWGDEIVLNKNMNKGDAAGSVSQKRNSLSTFIPPLAKMHFPASLLESEDCLRSRNDFL